MTAMKTQLLSCPLKSLLKSTNEEFNIMSSCLILFSVFLENLFGYIRSNSTGGAGH